MADVYVAAGSNIEPEENLAQALAALQREFGALTVSPAYRNQAVGFAGADFINLVVRFGTERPALGVKRRLEAIETLCGRPRTAPKWAPRAMDLDMLMYDAVVSDAPDLRLPRPDLLRRAFMLKPLVDIAPDLEHPTEHRTMRELWEVLQRSEAGRHELVAVTIPRFGHRPPPGPGQ